MKTFGDEEQEHVDALTATINDLGGKPVKAPEVDFGDAFSSAGRVHRAGDHVRGHRRQRLQRRRADDRVEGPAGDGRRDRPGRGAPRGGDPLAAARTPAPGGVRPDPDEDEVLKAVQPFIKACMQAAVADRPRSAPAAALGGGSSPPAAAATTRPAVGDDASRRRRARRGPQSDRPDRDRRLQVRAAETITVDAGTKVTWTNGDEAAHTATADDGSFDTGTLDLDDPKAVSFDEPGTYSYYCRFHPFMKATVEVNLSESRG